MVPPQEKWPVESTGQNAADSIDAPGPCQAIPRRGIPRRITEVLLPPEPDADRDWCEVCRPVPCVSVAGFVRVRRFRHETFSLEVSVNLFEQTTMVLEW